MKIGDLVKQVCRDGVGVVVERQRHVPDELGTYWRILFGSELNYVREADLEVINESR